LAEGDEKAVIGKSREMTMLTATATEAHVPFFLISLSFY
jgi:hypothetical protein